MEKLFNPKSIVILGLSKKSSNVPRIILENLIRWGFMGRIFGVNPTSSDVHVDGVRMYQKIEELPIVPDLCVALIPAKFIPDAVESCGKSGISWMAIPSGGFNETGEEGKKIAELTVGNAKKYGVRFVGPNGLTVANTSNGLCLPFVPLYKPLKGGFSIITQSGGLGLMLWNLMNNGNVGLAKFASIGNKLDLTEIDFLEYFGADPETNVIGVYLESITNGRKFIETASKINKPIIVLKANTTSTGNMAAMSHTASISNNDEIIDSAFERSGIIRISSFSDFISMAKAFKLPPMKGNRIMVMSPAGGFSVILADLCEKAGFEFADPGHSFYKELEKYSNAGVINFSNPLDMGDIYDPEMYAQVFFSVLHNDNVDGAIYLTQWPTMPRGEDVFTKMFNTDLSKEAIGALHSSGKPMGVCLYGSAGTMMRIKQNIAFPLFDSPEEIVNSLKAQKDFYKRGQQNEFEFKRPTEYDQLQATRWIGNHSGDIGEESLDLMTKIGVKTAQSLVAKNPQDAIHAANQINYPVVMKVVSPDALHKSEAGGVFVNIKNDKEVEKVFQRIKSNLIDYNPAAVFDGVRVMEMAADGHDMFIGGKVDESFGPVVYFGYGGIYIEIFKDIENVLCPSNTREIVEKLHRLKCFSILKGTRGKTAGDIDAYVHAIECVSHLLSENNEIKELDINPIRILPKGVGVMALDARMKIDKS
ncbi:MAG: acetate--CoA ligase family protein [Desulfobacteraceae bacterium]|nr:acetate--CoA ligase family protein [Desulfobacteraceae bacterium]